MLETAAAALQPIEEADEVNRTRDELLRRTDQTLREGTVTGPLAWDDVAALAQGLAFAEKPLRRATAKVTERYSLGPRGAWTLNLIAAGFAYPHELADIFEIGRSLVSAEIARLTAAGLITSTPGSDRRRTELALTELGRAALGEIRAELDGIIRAGLARYTADEVRLCGRMLRDLRQVQWD
jgi:DNA-binding MarR family transcriptional regulator